MQEQNAHIANRKLTSNVAKGDVVYQPHVRGEGNSISGSASGYERESFGPSGGI